MISDDKILFKWPCPEMKSAAEDHRAEHFAYGENELHGGALFESMEYDQWDRSRNGLLLRR